MGVSGISVAMVLVFTVEDPQDAEVVGVGVEIKQLHFGDVLKPNRSRT
jgi:hypothetical protein